MEIPTNIFLPIELVNINELTKVAASMVLNVQHLNKHSSKEVIGLIFQEKNNNRGNESVIYNYQNCSLHFLPKNKQKIKPYGQYENNNGEPFLDVMVPLNQQDSKSYSLLYPLNVDLEESIESGSRAIASYNHDLDILVHSDNILCHPLPDRVATKKGANALLEVSVGTKLPDEAISDILPQLIKDPIMALLMPILKLLGVFGGDKMMTPLEDNMSQMTDSGLTGELAEQIAPKLIIDLQQGIPPGVQAAAPETITQAVATMMQTFVKESLLGDVPTPTAIRVATGLARSHVAQETSDRTSSSIAKGVTRDTVHTLTRSLTHAVVPAISHTVTHNPMQDYYCYYCFKHKAYCQYCNYSPQQLYYNMFYAGFYSTYFGDYYSST